MVCVCVCVCVCERERERESERERENLWIDFLWVFAWLIIQHHNPEPLKRLTLQIVSLIPAPTIIVGVLPSSADHKLDYLSLKSNHL